MLTAALDSITEIGSASAAIPAIAAEFTVHNDQDVAHQVKISFPGVSAGLNLDNALERISLQASLSSPEAYITVDDMPAARLFADSQIDGFLQSYAGGHGSINFSSAFAAQIEIAANGIIDGDGEFTAEVAAGTSLYFPFDAEQAKVISGSILLNGSGSFLGSLNAQADSCIAGQENSFPLQVVACQ